MTAASPAVRPVTGSASTGARWASGPCAALGQRFTVEAPADDAALAARLTALVAPLHHGPGNPGDETLPAVAYALEPVGHTVAGPLYALRRDGHRVDRPGTADYATRVLAWDVNQSAVAAARRHGTVLHAGAVASRGDVVLLAAPMEHGKTTTTAGLLTSGWDYVTDEAVALDSATLGVQPFPKALSLDPGSWPLFPAARPVHAEDGDGQWLVPCAALGARVATGPLVPRLVLLPRYVAAATTRARELHPAEALYRLAQCCFGFPAGGAADLAALADLVRSRPTFELRVGSLSDAVGLVAELADRAGVRVPAPVTGQAPPPAGWSGSPDRRDDGEARDTAGATSTAAPATVDPAVGPAIGAADVPAKAPGVTVHVLDGEAVALGADGDLHHLDSAATLVWQRFDGTVTVSRAAEALARALAADPDVVRADVLLAVSQMAGRGLLTV